MVGCVFSQLGSSTFLVLKKASAKNVELLGLYPIHNLRLNKTHVC